MDETEILEAMEKVLKKETFTSTEVPGSQELFNKFVDWINERLGFDLMEEMEPVFDAETIEQIIDKLAASDDQVELIDTFISEPFWH